MAETHPLILAAMARRTKLVFSIPDREELWSCFPSSEAVAQKWITSGARKGWSLVERIEPR